MNTETSLRSSTLRAVAFLLGGSLAFVGLLCGALVLVSAAVGGPSSKSTPTSVDSAQTPALAPAGPSDVRGAKPTMKKSGTSI